MDISFGCVEPALSDDGVDFALDRPNADLPGRRDLLEAVARREEVERGLAECGLRNFARLCGRSVARAGGLGQWVHEGSFAEW